MTCDKQLPSDAADQAGANTIALTQQLTDLRSLVSHLLKENQELRYALAESRSAKPEELTPVATVHF